MLLPMRRHVQPLPCDCSEDEGAKEKLVLYLQYRERVYLGDTFVVAGGLSGQGGPLEKLIKQHNSNEHNKQQRFDAGENTL